MILKTKVKASLFAAAIAAVAMASCSKGDKEQPAAQEQDEAPLVKIEKVYETDVMQKGVYTTSVDADLVNNISSSTPNRIKEIYVDEGMEVAKGQRLVVLDDVNIVAYETQVANAQASVESAKASYDNVKVNYDRALELFKIGGGTKQNVDAMETQLISAKNNLTSAQNSLAAARRTLQNARSRLR